MAGGRFDPLIPKVLPGTYINYTTQATKMIQNDRGITLIPLIDANWGEEKNFIEINPEDVLVTNPMLGYGTSQDNLPDYMIMIREAFKSARKVIGYRLSTGAKATVTQSPITVEAKYSGELGNNLKLSITKNPVKGMDVYLYLGDKKVYEANGMVTIAELPISKWVNFTGEGELAEIASKTLTGGTTVKHTNDDVTTLLETMEGVKWNTMAFPFEDSALQTTAMEKIKFIRDEIGKPRQIVLPKATKPDFEGIINVTNGVMLSDGKEINEILSTAWIGAATSSATMTQSLTYATYPGALSVLRPKTYKQSLEAVKNGEIFFIEDDGEIKIQYDINSLVTYSQTRPKQLSKNRVLRVFDTLQEQIYKVFKPGKYDNNPSGWSDMETQGRIILNNMFEDNAIQNVDLDNDFKVDRIKSKDDSTYINIGVQAVDSADKLYFTIDIK